jgi:hypothetical protein
MTRKSQYAYRARQEAEAEQRALYEEPLWERFLVEAYATSDEELECLSESSTSEPSIAPEAPEATTKAIDRCWEAPTKETLAEAQDEQKLLDEIWASIEKEDWTPPCKHTEIINYRCLECGINFC